MSIKEIKQKSKIFLKKNFSTLAIVSVFMSIFIGEYIISNDGLRNLQILEDILYDKKENQLITTFSEKNSDSIINEYVDKAIFNLISGNTLKKINKYNDNHNVTKGVFFTVFNVVTNGQIQFQNLISSIATYTDTVSSENLFFIIGSAIALIIKVFLLNPFIVGEDRLFLENINYSQTKFKRLTYAFKKDYYKNIVKTLFVKNMYLFFWDITIIGGIIKNYSYKMVDFIIAENSNIKTKNAIILSRNMMNGYKFKAFKIDVSFIGWFFCEYITFGLAGIYVNPYYKACYTELYNELRKKYIQEKKHGYEELNDEILFNKEIIKEKYPIIYESLKGNIQRYPDKSEINEKKELSYNDNYEVTSLILMFFLFSFVGWIWECIYILIEKGVLANRGALYGPWIPIYGFGCTAILLVTKIKALKRILKNPVKTFFLVMTVCTLLEYITSIYLEATKGVKYWDYTGIFLNIQGRVCLENSLFFGIGGCACLYFIGPYLEEKIQKISYTKKICFCSILITLIFFDIVYSTIFPRIGAGITDEIKNISFYMITLV